MTELQVPGFDPVELLGYGSGGEVWLARERVTGRPVALKRLRAGADLAARDRLRREAAVLAGVDHPHVVRLRSVHGDGDAFVLVLDLAPGGSLARLLTTRRRLAPGEVVTLAVPLAQALATVHGQGLVHGDVTPANVLFGADGRPLLSDLGVSRLLGSPPGEVGGTRGFLDPVVAAGAAPGPASDVHGLAATCLAALTGVPPYDELGRRVAVPEGTSAALLGVLEPALAPDPAFRPSAEALAVAMFDAAAAEPVRFDRVPGPVLLGAAPGVPWHAGAVAQPGEVGPVGEPVAPPTHRVSPGPRPAEEAPAVAPGRRRSRADPGAGPGRGGGSTCGSGRGRRWPWVPARSRSRSPW
jgi:serine/threonine protein kinase